MKQILTLFLFFFSISLSAQILTNSTKVGDGGYFYTFKNGVFLQKDGGALNTTAYSLSKTVNDSSGKVLFFNSVNALYTKDGELMPHFPRKYTSSSPPINFVTVYMGNGVYRCYYNYVSSIYSFTVDMKLNNGKGDLVDSIPTLHFSETLRTIRVEALSVLQTDTLTHSVVIILAPDDSIHLAKVVHNDQSSSSLRFSGVGVSKLKNYWFSGNGIYDDIKISNNKKYAIVYAHFLFDISGNIPVFMKEVREVQQHSEDRYVNSVFSPNDSMVYSFFRDDSLLTIVQTIVNDHENDSDYIVTYKINSNLSQGGWYLTTRAELLPNRKIVFDDNNGVGYYTYASINRPDIFGNGCQIVLKDNRFGGLISSGWFDGISTPQYFTQFGFQSLHVGCEGNVISNLSDTLFKTFVWYLPNGDSIVSSDRAPINAKFGYNGPNVLVLKGVTQTGYTAWFSDTVEISCFLKANFYSTDSLGCQWVAQTFRDSSCINTTSYDQEATWTWDFGDGEIEETRAPFISHVFKSSGVFRVKMIVRNNECIDSVIKERAILIKPAPKPGFSIAAANWCVSYPVTVKDEVGVGFTRKVYIWGDGDSIVSTDTATLFRHNYKQAGTYTIKQYLYSVSGCVSTVEQVVKMFPSYRVADALAAPTVSVLNNGSIAIRFQKVNDPKGYQIYRSDLGWFETIKDTSFIDYTTNVSEQKYTYAVRVMDHCDNVSLASQNENSILLTGVTHKQVDVVLSANHSLISNEPHQLMTETASGEFVELVHDFKNTYTDTKFYNDSMWDRTYFIQYCSKSDTSCDRMYSNKVVFTYVPDVFIPSIISKNQNPFFVPKCTLISSGDIVIYDIMGRKVYEGNNLNDPIYIDHFGQGYHVYEVNGKSRDHKDYSQRGKILVVE